MRWTPFRRRRPAPPDTSSLTGEIAAQLGDGRLPLAARLALGREATARYEESVRTALDALRQVDNPPHLTPAERKAQLMPRIDAMRSDGRLSEERYEEIRRFLEEGVERSEGGDSRG